MHNLEINQITKKYQNNVTALENISFFLDSGVFGLLGNNGAGKTTLMKIIVTLLQSTEGNVSVCGFDTHTQGEEVRRLIGYLPQELPMYPSLSTFEFVSYMAELKGVYNKDSIKEVLHQVGMSEFSKRKICQLSGGMKRRVGIAQALVGAPKILVVDEPTAGLDPEERMRLRGVLSNFAKSGRTVLISTHILEDVYQICENLAVLSKGKLFFAGSSADLIKRVEGKVKLVYLEREEQLISLQQQSLVLTTAYNCNGLTARIVDENMNISQADVVPATLEDAYIYCIGGKENA